MATEHLRQAIEQALNPGAFFVAPPWRLRIEHAERETIAWEIFHGQLLPGNATRESATFESWHVSLDAEDHPGEAPLVSLRYDRAADRLHVTRQILMYGFEAYEDTPGVILSRETQRWTSELIGSIELREIAAGELARELARLVLQAVIGVSRLPITSLESPLPAFSLGQLAYLPGLPPREAPLADAIAWLRAAIDSHYPLAQQARALETALRAATASVAEIANLLEEKFGDIARREQLDALFAELFNGAALSPYTDFTQRTIDVLVALADEQRLGPRLPLDVLGRMLRQLCRHLTAFDLTLFHNFGANYPDALFLDALLRAYLKLIETVPALLQSAAGDAADMAKTKRLRRRALRQGCLLRKQYEGHRVPDAPTSMGENARVLPAEFARVPAEQITQTAARRRTLFADAPLESLLHGPAREAFQQSLDDLGEEVELCELGMAQYLARPLGICKPPGEPDRTPLVSYEAFSRAIAKRRLTLLKSAGWIAPEARERLVTALAALRVAGVAAGALETRERPGVVSATDANKAAADFVFLRSTRGSLGALLALYNWRPLEAISPATFAWLSSSAPKLLLEHLPEAAPPALRFYDGLGRVRLELAFDLPVLAREGYRRRGAVEVVDRLQVAHVAEVRADESLDQRDLRSSEVWIALASGSHA